MMHCIVSELACNLQNPKTNMLTLPVSDERSARPTDGFNHNTSRPDASAHKNANKGGAMHNINAASNMHGSSAGSNGVV